MKAVIRIPKNPFVWLAYVAMAIGTYAYFTVSSIPLITYIMLGGVFLYAMSNGSLKRSVGCGYFAYLIIQLVYVFVIGMISTSQPSMTRSIIYQMIVCMSFYIYASAERKSIDLIVLFVAVSVTILNVNILSDESLMKTISNAENANIYYTFEENNRNVIGMILGIGSLYMLYLGYTKGKIWFAPMILSVGLGLITGSRKSLLAAVLGILLYIYLYSKYCLQKKRSVGKLSIYIAILAVILVLYACYNNPVLYNIIGVRIEGFIAMITGEGNQEASAVIRSRMIEKAFEMFKEKPFMGWGIEGFAQYSGFGVYSHNNYMETLVSFGLFGFLMMYGGKFWFLWRQMKAIKAQTTVKLGSLYIIVFVLMVISLVMDFAAITMNGVITNMPFALSAAMLFSGRYKEDIEV